METLGAEVYPSPTNRTKFGKWSSGYEAYLAGKLQAGSLQKSTTRITFRIRGAFSIFAQLVVESTG